MFRGLDCLSWCVLTMRRPATGLVGMGVGDHAANSLSKGRRRHHHSEVRRCAVRPDVLLELALLQHTP